MRKLLAGLYFFLDQLGNRLRRLGALLYPSSDLILIELNAAGFGARVVSPNLFDVSTIPWKALVTDNDTIEGFFLCSMPAHTNGYAHDSSISFN
jgi:hypothetical protein